MRSVILISFLFFSSIVPSFAQQMESIERPQRHAVTVGVLQGGGSLIGVDYELMVGDRIGIQAGAGLIGFGAGVNWHFHSTARSSAVSLQFWNQGVSGDNLSQRVIGLTYLYRAEGGFTFQAGLGPVVTKGKLMDDYYKKKGITNPPALIAIYSIGWYF